MKFLKDGKRCLCGLVAKFPLDVSTLSQHLKVLRGAGLTLERREGVSKYFSLSNGKILTTLHRRKRGIRFRNAGCGWIFHNGAGSVLDSHIDGCECQDSGIERIWKESYGGDTDGFEWRIGTQQKGCSSVEGGGCSLCGVWTASQLTGRFLTVMFGVVTLLDAIRMLTAKEVIAQREKKLSAKTLVLWGLILGFFCGFVGIGGGALMVPVMVLMLGF